MIQIRVATTADAASIALVHVAAWQVAYRGLIPDDLIASRDVSSRTERWREILSQPNGVTFVAVEPQLITGFCNLIPSRDADAKAGDVAEITSFYIHPDHWRKGIGRALFHSTAQEARKRDFTVITLWVLKMNLPAIRFYEALGFTHDGRVKTEKLKEFELHELRFRFQLK